jgi:methionine aminopeptidase
MCVCGLQPRQLSQALMGASECVKHGLLHPYPVLVEKAGAQVAHFKFTALLLPGGTLKVAGLTAPTGVKSDKERK